MKDEELNQLMEKSPLEKKKNIAKEIFDLLPSSSQDWVIVASIVVLVIIWIADLFILDPLPFIDEIILPLLAYLVSQWYANRKKDKDNSVD